MMRAMRTPRTGSLAIAAWLAACHPQAAGRAPTPACDAAPAFSAAAISADIRFLADDLLEGRDTGSRGERIAQRYVAARFAASGVRPGAGDGYVLPVRFRAATVVPGSASATFHPASAPGQELPLGEYVPLSDGRTPHVDVTAPAVFVGYAITAPEYHYDDLAGVDLHGKIAVFYGGSPESDRADFFPRDRRAIAADSTAKLRRLAERGAVGAIRVWRTEDDQRYPWAKLAVALARGELFWLHGDELGNSPDGIVVRGMMSAAQLAHLADAAGVPRTAIERRPDEGARPAVDLGVVIHARYDATFAARDSADIVGLVPGRDPALAGEYVVYTAHLDHVGANPALPGDHIFNGAMDNASGVATVLQVAAAFARQPARRSVLVVATTGEEAGLLGGAAFVAAPPVPRAQIVADLNVDDVPGLHPLYDVVPLGLAMTTLGPHARAAAAALGLRVSPDPEPEQGYFGRGDNLPFAQAGIPALRVEPGDGDARGDTTAGRRLHATFIATRYHTPHDEWLPTYDYAAMAELAHYVFDLGTRVANDPARPRLVAP